MERTWRWFGKKDKITLAMLRQIGVEGIVTALHDVPLGEVWTREKIRDLQQKKADLLDTALGGEGDILKMSANEVLSLLE